MFILVTGAFAKTLVAVVETKAANDVLTKEEKFFVTDKLREIANQTLPAYQDFSIMTRENIEVMLPPGKTIEECEGSCLAETGRNIAADFIAQARVGRFAEKLTLTVEMYETKTGKLVSSFTGTSDDAVTLLDVIEREAGKLFQKIKRGKDDAAGYVGPDGFSEFSDGESYSAQRSRFVIVPVNSDPEGALLSVDGDPVPNCKETPCKIQLEAGSHRFSLVADMYQKKDSIVDVQQGTVIEFRLKPLFGILDVDPSFEKNYYLNTSTYATLDGDYIELGENRLKPGSYDLKVTNDCYESMSATVTVKTGSQLKFDRMMKAAKGGLTLSATRDNEPVEEPVYIDGKYVGRTPYSGTVPVCASVTIGDDFDEVPVTIPYHDDVSYTYQFASRKSYETSYREMDGDDYSYAPSAVATRARGTPRRSESRVNSSETTQDNSSSAVSESGGYFQVLLGFGLDLPLSETAFDDTGLDFMLGQYYVEAFFGWKSSSGVFLGLGGGFGVHDPLVMDSSSSDGYNDYYGGLSEDEANDMLPSPSLAFLLSAELGVDFKMDADKYDVAVGLRGTAVFSEWPAFSVSFFFEMMSFIGMELGYTTITGDDLWESGGGVSIKMYFRFPGRPGVVFGKK
ncbi:MULTISPECIES: PEGA domain-containing protein [unclassified Fibrobacter]|uniref:PEGA domain-containing protein n=1 Tax=unclassified Fibrobacter TaxID=2634177 RepID=UPI001304EE41|nr:MULTISPECIES: PEGA domain-containing protein [unclassified Fibrobacter]